MIGSRHWFNPDKYKHDILVQCGTLYGEHTVWICTTGGLAIFHHPDAVAMAVGFIALEQPIEPLLDWALENAHLSGHYEHGDWKQVDDWRLRNVRLILNRMVCALTQQEEVT